jgi:hypothetical protein
LIGAGATGSAAMATANPATIVAEASMKAIPRMGTPFEMSDRPHIVRSVTGAKPGFSLD